MPADHSTDQPQRKTYWKSLLQISVPVAVVLARKKMPANQVVNLVPGMMIQFDMPFDQPLSLEVDQQAIAIGDVVKVGDKFGLKISNVQQTGERWIDVFAEKAARKPNDKKTELEKKPVAAE